MFGGVIIGFLCDLPWLTRPKRALVGWVFVFVTGNVIMGGGLAFENWFEAQGKTHFIVRTCLLHTVNRHLHNLGQRLLPTECYCRLPSLGAQCWTDEW
jgi:hypothetical protein